jgi:hypothetical protein
MTPPISFTISAVRPEQVWEDDQWQAAKMYKVVVGDFSGSGKIEIATLYDDNLSMTSLHLFWSAGPDRFQEQEVWHGKLLKQFA